MEVKASNFTLNHLINVSEETGQKWKDLELILSSADAWGLLRKDLITALGVQRAKRFLLRYGYKCGEHEARVLKDSINWESKMDWLVAGSKLHYLTGRTYSYPESFQVNMEKGEFHVSGYWMDSYEAKQHLNYFPAHNEPVCYYLAGYASGYTSACMGKKIIFKETKCKGKGDDYCSYIGKAAEDWGEEIDEELFYYEDDDMSGELDQMYRKVEQQKERLEIGYSLSRSLNNALLKGQGMDGFAKILGEKLHCNVLIEDKHFKEIASFKQTPGMEKFITARNTLKGIEKKLSLNDVVEAELTGQTFKLVTIPISVRNQIYGFLTVALNKKLNSFYRDLLERVAMVASLQIQYERIAIETEQRLKGELLEQLLNSKETNVQEIYNRFSYLGYDLTTPHYVLHIKMEDQNGKEVDNEEQLKIRNKLNNFYQEQNKFGSNMLILTKWNTVQAIISKKLIESDGKSIKKFAGQLLRKLDNPNCRFYIGVSEETTELPDFYHRAKEAKQAADLAKIRFSSSRIMLANELGHLSLFLYAREPEELKKFAEENLQPILEYDRKKNSELLQTLFHYTQNEFNLHKTAREMILSISGMRYRIQKIEELLNIDLSNSNSRFEVQLSLQIFLMLGKF
ncbi:XylR N-terminal domain-containing protein [Pseudalkalibacillus sp. R45]|uniref:XylR N-terminal domain-containing protein n=1 Tax=Pseudalkalibacillus sp. R45 TaxID=3457433 RepID=UPI003FCD5E36